MASTPPEPDSNDLDPPTDLLRTYRWMVASQQESMENIDEKALSIIRFNTVLLGLTIAAVTLIGDANSGTFTRIPQIGLSAVAIGVVALVLSMIFAVVSYLRSELQYGPNADLGHDMAEFTVPEHVYMEGLLSDYADAIPANETVLATNALWIRDALIGLVWGIVGIATGFLLLVVPLPATHVASFGITILAGLVLLTYAIVDETYMARDAQLET